MNCIRVQFHLTASFLNNPLPTVFGAHAKASTVFQSLFYSWLFSPITTTTAQTPVQLPREKTVPCFCVIFSTLLNTLLIEQFWETNTFWDTVWIQLSYFYPSTYTLASNSAENHREFTDAKMWVGVRWVHWCDDQTQMAWMACPGW